MKIYKAFAASVLLLGSACATVEVGGAPVNLPPDLVENGRVGQVYVSTAWLNSEDDFQQTFSDEVAGGMALCASGTHTLNLSVHVEAMSRAPRGAILSGNNARHRLRATAELKDPAQGGRVVGRYPISIDVPAGTGPLAAFTDRQAVVSQAFAEALCETAFRGQL